MFYLIYRLIIIMKDRLIGFPGHRKNVANGINICDKHYLIGKIFMIGTPEK